MNHGSSLLSDPRLKEYYEQLKKTYTCKDCQENPIEIYFVWLNHKPMYLCRDCMLECTTKSKMEGFSFGVQMKLHVGKTVENQIIKRKILLDNLNKDMKL